MPIARTRFAALVVAAAIIAAVFASIGGAAAKATAPTNTSLPELDGTAAQGQTVSTSTGSWSGTTPMTYTYLWQQCDTNGNACTTIGGERSAQITLTGDEVGHTLRATVTAHNSGGTGNATSRASDVVRGSTAPANTGKPSISGTTTVGSTLTTSNGTWTGSGPITYTYIWDRCDATGGNCKDISDAKSSTYTLTNDDSGHTMRSRVTATNAGGQGSIVSNATSVVQAGPPANTVAPTISGTPTQAQTLTVSDGTWGGTTPITYTYAWSRCDSGGNNCATISGATSHSYQLASADVGHTIRATVTATNGAGTSHATSAAVGPVVTNSTLPAGAVKLPDGEISIPAASVADTDRLTISQIKYSPGGFHGRGPITATIKVIDSNNYVVSGALVYLLPAPRNFANHPAEVPTGQNGRATVQLTLTAKAPRSGSLLLFIRARTPQGNLLAGSSSRRLVQVRIFAK